MPKAKNDQGIMFEAALAHSGRKCLSIDSDGEATLVLIIPASCAKILTDNFARLQDRSFMVVIQA